MPSSFWRQLVGSRIAAFLAAQLTERRGGWIPLVLDLTYGDVSDGLASLDRVAWALEPLRSHATNIAQREQRCTMDSRAPVFELIHCLLP